MSIKGSALPGDNLTGSGAEGAMGDGWRLFLISAVVLGAALALERSFVPGIVPVGFADEPQPLWAVETAFVLRAVELIAAGVAVISFTLAMSASIKRKLGERRAR